MNTQNEEITLQKQALENKPKKKINKRFLLVLLCLFFPLDMANFYTSAWPRFKVFSTAPESWPQFKDVTFIKAYSFHLMANLKKNLNNIQVLFRPNSVIPNATPYHFYKSGYVLSDMFVDKMFWIDDKRVIFNGWTEEKNDSFAFYERRSPTDIIIWDIENGASVYKEHMLVHCFAQNNIIYSGSVDGKSVFVYGKFGHEQQIPTLNLSTIDRINCKPYSNEFMAHRADVLRNDRRYITPLLDGHGYLHFQAHREKSIDPTLFYKTDGSVQPLDIPSGSIPFVEYYPFKQAYLIIGSPVSHISPWPEDQPHPIWWFYPDGRLEEMIIPPPWSALQMFYATARGFYLAAKDMREPLHERKSNAFLMTASSIEKLLHDEAGSVAVSVSPNGCRVAFASNYAEEVNEHGRMIYAVDLCK